MGSLNGGLSRLERPVPDGCDGCHRWGSTAHEIVREGAVIWAAVAHRRLDEAPPRGGPSRS